PHAEDPHTPALPNPTPETLAQFAAHLPNLKASAEEPTTPVIHAHATEISPVIPTERPARAEGPPHLSLRPHQRPHLSPPRHRNRSTKARVPHPSQSHRDGWDAKPPSRQSLTTHNSQLTTALILPTLHAVAEEPSPKPCRTPTRTRRHKTPTPPTDPTPTLEPSATNPTADPDLTRRATRLTRAFRPRYHPHDPGPTPPHPKG
ncbi:MAG: hypothetical protein ABR910_10395, partial [Acidobacteriaceae bacterium]